MYFSNLSRMSETGTLYGIHEISLTGNGGASLIYDVDVIVTFTTPTSETVVVRGFYNGGNEWIVRTYLNEVGEWTWVTECEDDGLLDGKNGKWKVVEDKESGLKGKLMINEKNKRQWKTDDGKTFLNLGDTGYILFNVEISDNDFIQFVKDDWELGITSIRAGGGGGYSSWQPNRRAGSASQYPRDNWCWDIKDTTAPYNYNEFDLVQLQKTDDRLEWLLNNYPGMYIQLIMLTKDDQVGDHWYNDMNAVQRERTIKYLMARWAAWPQVFFQIINDSPQTYGSYINTLKMIREIGNLMKQIDPWDNLRSAGPKRREECQILTDDDFNTWHNYVHMERQSVTDAWIVDYLYNDKNVPVHVYYGEDWYEGLNSDCYDKISNPDYFHRRIFWSVLLSDGSPAYGGFYPALIPYSKSGTAGYEYHDDGGDCTDKLTGLDSVIHIKNFFVDNKIDMVHFTPSDESVVDLDPALPEGATGTSRAQCSKRVDNDEFIIYLTCAADGEISGEGPQSTPDNNDYEDSRAAASVNTGKTPLVNVNLIDASTKLYKVKWMKADDGELIEPEELIKGGRWVNFTSPWKGIDVILYLRNKDLKKEGDDGDKPFYLAWVIPLASVGSLLIMIIIIVLIVITILIFRKVKTLNATKIIKSEVEIGGPMSNVEMESTKSTISEDT